uniref:Uncharacterized protein n=1 Tax=Hemiselmis andersenii TaxID=464988 RepID=A0A7S0TWH7_HEMAN|mmetsp:Transcript_28414/g.66174  ORF Transcript_28414/g.66174 Transcript_28414/m.66174 type:complete len:171 (+) Transcript_28414:335-847(+)
MTKFDEQLRKEKSRDISTITKGVEEDVEEGALDDSGIREILKGKGKKQTKTEYKTSQQVKTLTGEELLLAEFSRGGEDKGEALMSPSVKPEGAIDPLNMPLPSELAAQGQEGGGGGFLPGLDRQMLWLFRLCRAQMTLTWENTSTRENQRRSGNCFEPKAQEISASTNAH